MNVKFSKDELAMVYQYAAAALSLTPDSGLSRSGTIQSGAGWRKQRRRRGRKRPIPREKSQTGNGHNSFQSGKRGFPL